MRVLVIILLSIYFQFKVYGQKAIIAGEMGVWYDQNLIENPKSELMFGNLRQSVQFIIVTPKWETASRKILNVNENDFKKWLEKFNHTSQKNWKLVQKNPLSNSYILTTQANTDDVVFRSRGLFGAELDQHRRIFDGDLIDLYISVFKRTYLSEVKVPANVRDSLPFEFTSAYSPLAFQDTLINGRSIISFFKLKNDSVPAYYYNGFIKNGLFEGLGLFSDFKKSETFRGQFSKGKLTRIDEVERIIRLGLTSDFFREELMVTTFDSLILHIPRCFMYPELSSNSLEFYGDVRIFFKSEGKQRNAWLHFKRNASTHNALELAWSIGDDEINAYRIGRIKRKYDSTQRANAELVRIKEEEEKKIAKATGGGFLWDDSTAVKYGNWKSIISGCSKFIERDIIAERAVTVFYKKGNASWDIIGTWRYVLVHPCGDFGYYGTNLIDREKDYMPLNLLDELLAIKTLKFERTLISQKEMIETIVEFAKKRFWER